MEALEELHSVEPGDLEEFYSIEHDARILEVRKAFYDMLEEDAWCIFDTMKEDADKFSDIELDGMKHLYDLMLEVCDLRDK